MRAAVPVRGCARSVAGGADLTDGRRLTIPTALWRLGDALAGWALVGARGAVRLLATILRCGTSRTR